MSKIDEIRERAENCKRGNLQLIISSQDVINLCDALEFAKGKLIAHGYPFSASKIDQIIEKGKDG